MIYLFYGEDFKKVQKSSKALIQKLQKEKPDISVTFVDQDNFSQYDISSLTKEQGLFEKEILIIFDHLFTFKEFKDFATEEFESLSKSKNTFIFIESVLDQKIVNLFRKQKAEIQNFFLKQVQTFNAYALTDAFGEKNRRKLWVLYQKALLSGLSPEEIHGLLFWQVKNILIAKQSKSLKESEMKPYPFQKAKKFSENFSEAELRKFSENLVDIYHLSRTKGTDLNLQIEKFTLGI